MLVTVFALVYSPTAQERAAIHYIKMKSVGLHENKNAIA